MELRFVRREGDFLVFESADGTSLLAPIDESLREALRRNNSGVRESVSPKEVQAAIRAGESLQDLAARLGVPEESIEPFAAPILDELRFVLESALSTTLTANDRMRTFRELVEEAYPGSEFSIRKQEQQWILQSGSSLTWGFDPKSRTLEPISSAAKELAKTFNSAREVIRATPTAQDPVKSASAVEAYSDTPEEPEAQQQVASVHDLVQELRSRRNPEELKPASAKGRASLPSWDEIVLGAAGLESDSDKRDF